MHRRSRLLLSALAVLAATLSRCQSEEPPLLPPGGECVAGNAPPLSQTEILGILGRAVAEAQNQGRRATIAVINRYLELKARGQL